MIPALISAAAGSFAGGLFACVPGLHVYNVMAAGIVMLRSSGRCVPEDFLVPFTAGMVVSYAVLSTIPSVIFAAPDESAFFTVLPGQKMLLEGAGYAGVMFTAAGAFAALTAVIIIVAPVSLFLLPAARNIFRGHEHWILWCIIVYMLMSEWPRSYFPQQRGWSGFLKAWRALGAGILTFFLSGMLGLILTWRSPLDLEHTGQSLAPAFAGLFTMPWLIMNIIAGTKLPEQRISEGRGTWREILLGAFAGSAGGGFAAFFPGVTGGTGAFLAGQTCAISNDRAFLASQGASRMMYYVAGLFLFFVPGLGGMTRGGAAAMLSEHVQYGGMRGFYLILAAICIAGLVSCLMVRPLTVGALGIIARRGFRTVSVISAVIVVCVVTAVSGFRGIPLMFVSTAIGLVPVLFGARRMNCLGVILLPVACNLSGIGPAIAESLGLI